MTRYPFPNAPNRTNGTLTSNNYSAPQPKGYQGLWNLDFNSHLSNTPTSTPPPPGNGQPLIPGGPSTPVPTTPTKPPGTGGQPPFPDTPKPPAKPPGTGQPPPFPDVGKPKPPGTGNPLFPDIGKPIPTTPRQPVPTPGPNYPNPNPRGQDEKRFAPYGQTKSLASIARPSQLSPDGRWFTMPDGRRLDMNLYNPEGLEIEVDPTTGAPRFKPKAQTFGWEKYATPTGDGFTGVRNGQNYVNGHLFDAEGLNQGDANNPLGTGFGNWLREHAKYLNIDFNQIVGGNQVPQSPLPGGTTPTINPGILKGGADANGNPLTILNPTEKPQPGPLQADPRTGLPYGQDSNTHGFGPFAPGTVPTNPIGRGQGQDPFAVAPQQVPGTNPLTRNSNTYPRSPYSDFITGKGGGVAELPPGDPSASSQPRTFNELDQNGRNIQGEQEYDRIINGRDPYGLGAGRYGRNYNDWYQDPNADLSWMPEWLRRQYRWSGDEGEAGRQGQWTSDGPIRDAQGRQVVQIGNQSQAVGGDRSDDSVIDWNQVWYDDTLGMVTTPGNTRNIVSDSSRRFGYAVQAFIAIGALYVAAGASGLLTTPSGAVIAPEAAAGLEAATSVLGNEAVTSALGSLPAGQVSLFSQVGGYLQATVNGARMVWNGARWVMGAVSTVNGISRIITGENLINTGNPSSGNRSNNVSNNNNWLADLISGGAENYFDNRNIREFENRQNELLDRADYNREYRPGFLDRHARFLNDPNAMFEDPNYQAFEDNELGNLSRRFNARNMALSGNEMGGLADHQRTMRTTFRNNELNNLRQGAQLGNPERTYGDAMRYLPFLYQARGARNFDTTRAIQNALRNAPQITRDAVEAIRRITNGEWTLDDVSPEIRALLEEGAARHGQSVDDFLNSDEFINNLPGMDIDFSGDNTDIYNDTIMDDDAPWFEEWWDDIFGVGE